MLTDTGSAQMEQRLEGLQLRDVETTESGSMLRGRAMPYDEDADIGWFVESFAPGSLAKSITEAAAALPLLLFHNDRTFPIGAADSWDDERDALYGTWRLDKSDEATRAAQLARDGMLSFMSIRFAPVRSQWTYVDDWNPDLGPSHKDRVLRLEARLIETSLVSTPAYQSAAVEWVRTGERSNRAEIGKRQRAEWRAELERMQAGLINE